MPKQNTRLCQGGTQEAFLGGWDRGKHRVCVRHTVLPLTLKFERKLPLVVLLYLTKCFPSELKGDACLRHMVLPITLKARGGVKMMVYPFSRVKDS